MHLDYIASVVGKKYGRLTVTSYDYETKKYLATCDCGVTKGYRGYSLKSGITKSCGCLNKEARPHRHKPEHLSAKKEIYKNYKHAAKRRGYSFDLDLESFVSFIEKECKYCGSLGSNISPLKAHKDYKFNGVDRVDNTKGYTKDNCVTACKICNNSKASLTLEEWDEWIENIYKGRLLRKKLKGEHYGNE